MVYDRTLTRGRGVVRAIGHADLALDAEHVLAEGAAVSPVADAVFADDELVEITPQNIRLRKVYLKESDRRKMANKNIS